MKNPTPEARTSRCAFIPVKMEANFSTMRTYRTKFP
jgi:hypothetical protein